MSNAIHDLPTDKNFGLEFNYALWTAGTVVTLCNVPWNSDYRDIVRFDNQAALDAYIDDSPSPKINIDKMSYAKVGRPIRVNIPFNAAYKYNYVRAHNPIQPILGDEARSFYYFITDVNYVNPSTTELYVQLDVWQTFGYGISFGNCYIEQGHIGIANAAQFSNYGKDYLTVPEGLDVGSEYAIEKQYKLSIGSARTHSLGMPDYSIMVTSSTSLDSDPGTVDAPILTSATGSRMEYLPNGAEIYLFNSLDHFKLYMETMKDKPWVTQGIMSIQAVPRMARYGVALTSKVINGVPIDQIEQGKLTTVSTALGNNWRDSIVFHSRYVNLKKFFTFPYMVIEMTSYTGTPLVLKPECWQDDNATVVELPHFAPPNARVSFYPYRYNATSRSPEVTDGTGRFVMMVENSWIWQHLLPTSQLSLLSITVTCSSWRPMPTVLHSSIQARNGHSKRFCRVTPRAMTKLQRELVRRLTLPILVLMPPSHPQTLPTKCPGHGPW